ncbi:hypothetical protein HCN44_009081 [Aphidius gifuensis]|uniref:Odorant-binding protein n=1 Tax=Aphidius gifuensis TaxID=684658 RepID=A0A835CNB7_APHGI|nr:hypothetical protein HCN44_009081 [Aphidius gifuensis]
MLISVLLLQLLVGCLGQLVVQPVSNREAVDSSGLSGLSSSLCACAPSLSSLPLELLSCCNVDPNPSMGLASVQRGFEVRSEPNLLTNRMEQGILMTHELNQGYNPRYLQSYPNMLGPGYQQRFIGLSNTFPTRVGQQVQPLSANVVGQRNAYSPSESVETLQNTGYTPVMSPFQYHTNQLLQPQPTPQLNENDNSNTNININSDTTR